MAELVVFNQNNNFHDALKSESRLFSFCNKNIVVQQGWKPDGHGGTDIGFGASVYDCSVVLANYLSRNMSIVKNKKVVELGCGPGLATIVAGISGAAVSIATDGDQASVDLAHKNISANSCNNCQTRKGDKLAIDELQCELAHDHCNSGRADVILAADVSALPYAEAYPALVSTLKALCRSGGTVLLCYQVRHSSESDFFVLLEAEFFVSKLPMTAVHEDFHSKPIALYQCTPRRPAVLREAVAVLPPIAPLDMRHAFRQDSVSGARAADDDHYTRFPELTTDRLVLRRIRPEDACDWLDVHQSLAHIIEWGGRVLQSVEDAQQKVAETQQDLTHCRGIRWAITRKSTDTGCTPEIETASDEHTAAPPEPAVAADSAVTESEIVTETVTVTETGPLLGTLGFWRVDCAHHLAELGYEMHMDSWGHGYMLEAMKSVVAFGFQQMHLHSIEANVDPRNKSSIQVLVRAGFTIEGNHRENYLCHGEYQDSCILRLLARDWHKDHA